MNYWIFNTDETEDVGKGKHEAMLSKCVIAAHGWCKGKRAERTLNQPDPGDVIFYYRAGHGFIASAVAANQNSEKTDEIFKASGEYMRPVTEVKILKEDEVVTAAEVKSATGRTTSYRHIVSQIHHQEVVDYLLKRFKKIKSNPGKKKKAKRGSGSGGFQPDPEKRVRVEKAAVKHVTKIYKGEGWKVESVEQEKVGYDLYCTKTNNSLGRNSGESRYVQKTLLYPKNTSLKCQHFSFWHDKSALRLELKFLHIEKCSHREPACDTNASCWQKPLKEFHSVNTVSLNEKFAKHLSLVCNMNGIPSKRIRNGRQLQRSVKC